MRVGVLANIQHSMFSCGATNTSLAVAELMKELGHDVSFLQMVGEKPWWDDCHDLQKHWKVVSIQDAKDYDLIFEIDRMTLTSEKRARVAKTSILIIRKPFLLQELESSHYPTTTTVKREYDGLKEIWIFDAAAEMEKGVTQAIELLARVPVRVVPYVWSPSIAATYMKENAFKNWLEYTVNDLKAMGDKTQQMPPWNVHIAETNTTNASSAVLPLVMLRESKRRGMNIGRWKVHNSDMITKSKFFMENIVKHCSDSEVGLSGEFIGRQRCIDWLRDPMSCILSHMRFTAIRPLLFDATWAGIPLVHNSAMLRDIGQGLERCYYSDNHVGEACDALKNMHEDLITLQGIFAPLAINTIRLNIVSKFSPLSSIVKAGWQARLDSLNLTVADTPSVAPAPAAPAPAAPAPAPAAPAPAAVPVAPTPISTTVSPPATLRVGFCDMWDDFNPSYNFFTLMLSDAAAKLNPPVSIVAGPATPEDAIVIFGPFGEAWKRLPEEQPKIHFTGENTAPVQAPGVKLNLGFHHFDMTNESYLRFPLWILEIDWFGADHQKIVNPKPIPLERCTNIFPAELARKKKFCAFVVSNPNNPIRNAAFQWLSEYKEVDSAGRLFNNLGPDLFAGGGGGGGELKKLEFLKDYKFCLTYENNSSRGYTTEKYLHAKAAGCIPIYWGDPTIEREFNINGCIDAREFKCPEDLIEAVKRVDTNDSEWLKRFAVPALDDYRVAWAQRTMAECARRMFKLGGLNTNSCAEVVGDTPVVKTPPAVTETPSAVTETPSAVETPIMVTCATRRYLPSLQHWLISIGTQTRADKNLKAIIFLSSDVPEDTVVALKEKFPFAEFERLPDSEPPHGAFEDFWEPQHFGWKLWLLNNICGRPELRGRMVFYTDAGVFMCRWPKEWMLKTQANDICFLEDPREENARWCSPVFQALMRTTEKELASQQIQAALIMFRAGAAKPTVLFRDSMEYAKHRGILAGPKWAGKDAEGRHFGHRHDQSILSIASLRLNVSRFPLDTVYCDKSLRKTFTSGRAMYVHRGNFQVHEKFTEGIDDAYVINLDRRSDRLERLWSNCPELVGRVERWSAIEGRNLSLTPALQRLLAPNDFLWKKAIAGCALSHLGLWWKLANESAEIDNYLILEDDVKFRSGWEHQWKKAVNDIPDDYDIIYLGGVLPPNRAAFESQTKERINDSFCRIKENTQWGQKTPTRYFHFCAYAYILTKKGAQKVMDLLENADGYWTSADHILCNPVTILKSYILDPMVAGCYQDDDPKYANSQFNDFNRIDGFDSDLWNNDERFTEAEIKAATVADSTLDIQAALRDARERSKVDIVGAKASITATDLKKELVVEREPVKAVTPVLGELPIHLLGKRLVCISDQKLNIRQLYECDWLLALFGNPSSLPIDSIKPSDPPPTDCPIVIVQRPHIETTTYMLEKWDSYGAKFSILHLSDEHLNDDLTMYSLDACQKVMRFYLREDMPEKVTTIPLGYHWTLHEGSQNMLVKTPRLPFRSLTWSFFGTNWNRRREEIAPLFNMPTETFSAKFFDDWKDASSLPKDQYMSTLLDTVFVPCPDGVNPETFRFYEALEAGCIPLLVKTEKNAAWIDWVTENVPILPIANWNDAKQLVDHLMKEKPLLEAYRAKVLSAWIEWRGRLKDEVKDWLHRA